MNRIPMVDCETGDVTRVFPVIEFNGQLYYPRAAVAGLDEALRSLCHLLEGYKHDSALKAAQQIMEKMDGLWTRAEQARDYPSVRVYVTVAENVPIAPSERNMFLSNDAMDLADETRRVTAGRPIRTETAVDGNHG